MDSDLEAQERERGNAKVLRSWAKQANRYDKSMRFFERRVRWALHPHDIPERGERAHSEGVLRGITGGRG